MKEYIVYRDHVQVINGSQTPLDGYPAACMDIIVALDVLEDVADLSATLDLLLQLLKPGSQLIILGPTESVFYQLGRKLAGNEFSGAYHERGVEEIIRASRQRCEIRIFVTLFPLSPYLKLLLSRNFKTAMGYLKFFLIKSIVGYRPRIADSANVKETVIA